VGYEATGNAVFTVSPTYSWAVPRRSLALVGRRRRSHMLKEELSRLCRYEERHRRLLARLTLASVLSLVVYLFGTVLVWIFESGR
jgi:hypothetical protein